MVEIVSCNMHQKLLLLQTFIKNIRLNAKLGSYPSLFSFTVYCQTPPQWQLTFVLCVWLLTSRCWKMMNNGLK